MLNDWAKVLLSLASMSPFCLVLGTLYIFKNKYYLLAFVWIGIGIFLLLISAYLLKSRCKKIQRRKISRTKGSLTSVRLQNKDVGYFVAYVFPLLTSWPENGLSIGFSIVIGICLLIYCSLSPAYSVNPIVSWGYKVYEAEDETGVSFILFSKHYIRSLEKPIEVAKIAEHTFIIVSDKKG